MKLDLAALPAVVRDCLPVLRGMATGRHAISVSGSWGKGTADGASDFDFRLYGDSLVQGEAWKTAFARFAELRRRGEREGVTIDDFWARAVADVEGELQAWLDGKVSPPGYTWTIWGYHLLPDLHHQAIVEDAYGIVAGWKERLSRYPPALKAAIVDKHLGSLRYWRRDYHYANKVTREDPVFLAGLSARLVHDLMQVLFAVNETYYVGDGSNLTFAARFRVVPPRLEERIEHALYPGRVPGAYREQYQTLVELIDDVEALVSSALSSPGDPK